MAEVTLPQLGETVTEGTITQWFKAVGDTVAEDEPLFEVSTDKVDTEVPSPVHRERSPRSAPKKATPSRSERSSPSWATVTPPPSAEPEPAAQEAEPAPAAEPEPREKQSSGTRAGTRSGSPRRPRSTLEEPPASAPKPGPAPASESAPAADRSRPVTIGSCRRSCAVW